MNQFDNYNVEQIMFFFILGHCQKVLELTFFQTIKSASHPVTINFTNQE